MDKKLEEPMDKKLKEPIDPDPNTLINIKKINSEMFKFMPASLSIKYLESWYKQYPQLLEWVNSKEYLNKLNFMGRNGLDDFKCMTHEEKMLYMQICINAEFCIHHDMLTSMTYEEKTYWFENSDAVYKATNIEPTDEHKKYISQK